MAADIKMLVGLIKNENILLTSELHKRRSEDATNPKAPG